MAEVQWNKKNLGKWIKALRDPKNKQTKGCLQRIDEDGKVVGNCCLGLAARISRVGKFEPLDYPGVAKFKDNVAIDGFLGRESSYLSTAVMRWLGVKSGDPSIELPPEYGYEGLKEKRVQQEEFLYSLPFSVTCTKMNDNEGWKLTFPQIADMLEYFVYNQLPDA